LESALAPAWLGGAVYHPLVALPFVLRPHGVLRPSWFAVFAGAVLRFVLGCLGVLWFLLFVLLIFSSPMLLLGILFGLGSLLF
jgi:hypothetical protein